MAVGLLWGRENEMPDDKPIRLLIIEDDRVDRELYKQCLRQSGAQRWEFAESGTATAGIGDWSASLPRDHADRLWR